MAVTKQLRISGRVQGVGYRYALQREAVAHGVAGWVRNRRDGTVEALLQGDAAAVDAVLTWTRRGPPAARVERVDVQPAEASGNPYGAFEQLPTA
jgi:acylphosphatase